MARKKQIPDERRKVEVSSAEIDLLLYLIRAYDKNHYLLRRLEEVKAQFSDYELKLKELVATARANSFWMQPQKNFYAELRKQREEQKEKRIKVQQEIACLTPEQMKKMLEERNRRNGVVEKNGEASSHVCSNPEGNVIEDGPKPVVPDTEQLG